MENKMRREIDFKSLYALLPELWKKWNLLNINEGEYEVLEKHLEPIFNDKDLQPLFKKVKRYIEINGEKNKNLKEIIIEIIKILTINDIRMFLNKINPLSDSYIYLLDFIIDKILGIEVEK